MDMDFKPRFSRGFFILYFLTMQVIRMYSKPKDFEITALRVFQQQSRFVQPYREFIDYLGVKPGMINRCEDIPFLPIELFKTQKILDRRGKEKQVFLSSGTSGMQQSRHYVQQPWLYEESLLKNFEWQYGPPENFCFLALLPSYLERKGSSLVYMMKILMEKSECRHSGFFLNDYKALNHAIEAARGSGFQIMLIGVSFALLDFAEEYSGGLEGAIVMETGGMKGRRKEIIRSELHRILTDSFGVESIHSEYGMTELLSQAYSKMDGIFRPAPWMKVFIKDIHDPFGLAPQGKSGRMDIIDLANIYSCSFISTSDIGRLRDEGRFEVLGRLDNSDIRGCNLLALS